MSKTKNIIGSVSLGLAVMFLAYGVVKNYPFISFVGGCVMGIWHTIYIKEDTK